MKYRTYLYIWALISLVSLHASDGTLDPSFGAGTGFVQTPAGFFASKVAVQTDGKILVIGRDSTSDQLVRYDTNGTLDATFGIGGIVLGSTSYDFNNVTIQPDGKILVVGQDTDTNSFLVIRYLTDGSLDATFGTGGIVTGPAGFASAVALQRDSKIVAAGSDDTNTFFTVVRYDSAGVLDTIFTSGPLGIASGIIIEPSDKVVVAGSSNTNNVQVVRYNPDGTLDATFGIGGIAIGPQGTLGNLLEQPDGKFIVGSYTFLPQFQSVRFTNTGILDVTYGVGGIALGPTGTVGYALLQSDTKAVLVGASTLASFELARFTTGGILDVTFGIAGVTTGPTGFASGTASQADGKIIAVGSEPTFTNFQVARYIGGPALVDTQILSPVNGAKVKAGKPIIFSGTAQNPSMVYLFINDVLVKGTPTNLVTNTWAMTYTIPATGFYTARVVSIYQDGNVAIESLPITLQVGFANHTIC